MGKLIPVLCAGAGTAAVSVGGVYLMNSGSSYADMGFRTLADFQKQNGGHLTKDFFDSDIDFNSKGTAIADASHKLDDAYFTTDTSAVGESQLAVNWEHAESKSTDANNKKWKGGFRWLWNFKRGNRGFSVFVTTKPSTTEKTLDLEGGLYVLERENDKWTVKKHKELPTSTTPAKVINATDFDKALPKAHTNITAALKVDNDEKKNYWGFVKGKEDLDKLCKKDEATCPTESGQEQMFRRLWTWKSDANPNPNHKLAEWCDNFDQLVSHLFDNGNTNLKKSVESLQGSWTQI